MVCSQPQVAARPAWLPWREHANEWGEHTMLLSQREGGFVLWDYILSPVWERAGTFSKQPLNFPRFLELMLGLPSNQSTPSPDKIDRPLRSPSRLLLCLPQEAPPLLFLISQHSGNLYDNQTEYN